jgi:phosphoglycerate dehydrogenase-like enzyme
MNRSYPSALSRILVVLRSSMLKAIYIMNPAEWSRIYSAPIHSGLCRLVDILAPVLSAEQALARPDLLGQMDILLSGWGGPKLNHQFLEMAPNLQGVFYGAGAVGHLLTDAFLEKRIAVTTANVMNAIPVAEFSVAHIILGLKRAWQQALETKRRRAFLQPQLPVAGAYKSTVGLVSLSTIGRLTRQRLEPVDVRVIAYDPTVDDQEALGLDVEMASLEDIFLSSDVVSLHAPLLPETSGMITGALLASMKYGATFINTARGSIVRESEMIEVLRSRPDLTAILDVTDPEPPLPTCELFDLPNAIVTPHIAGSLDGECERMGRWMMDEVKRHLAGKPLLGRVHPVPTAGIPVISN